MARPSSKINKPLLKKACMLNDEGVDIFQSGLKGLAALGFARDGLVPVLLGYHDHVFASIMLCWVDCSFL